MKPSEVRVFAPLFFGITVNQLSNCKNSSSGGGGGGESSGGGGGRGGGGGGGPAEMISTLAIVYTVASVTIPSLASVYNEFALKKNFDTSVHLQNFFMYFYGAVFNLVGLMCVVVYRGGEGISVFHGHNSLTMLLVGLAKTLKP